MCLPLLLSSKTALVTNYLLTPSTSMVGGRIYQALSLALFLTSLMQQPHFNTMLALTSSTPTRLWGTAAEESTFLVSKWRHLIFTKPNPRQPFARLPSMIHNFLKTIASKSALFWLKRLARLHSLCPSNQP